MSITPKSAILCTFDHNKTMNKAYHYEKDTDHESLSPIHDHIHDQLRFIAPKIEFIPRTSGTFTDEEITYDRKDFVLRVENYRRRIPVIKQFFLENELAPIKHCKGIQPELLYSLPFIIFSLNDPDVIEKFEAIGIKPQYLSRSTNIDSLISDLGDLEKIDGISLLKCPIFASIHLYIYSKFKNDIIFSSSKNYKPYNGTKKQHLNTIYVKNFLKRIEYGGGNLRTIKDPILDHQYLNYYNVLINKMSDKIQIKKSLLSITSGHVELELLGTTLLQNTYFDEKKIKGDKKYELLFDLYKNVLKNDFTLHSKKEFDSVPLESYSTYDNYKIHFIKTNIFKKRNVLNSKT